MRRTPGDVRTRRRPLSWRLSLFVACVLVAALGIMVAASVLVMRSWMTAEVDRSLLEDAHRFHGIEAEVDGTMSAGASVSHPSARDGVVQPQSGQGDGVHPPLPEDGGPGLGGPGFSRGALRVLVAADGSVTGGVERHFDLVELTAPQRDALRALVVDPRPQGVTLDALGTYRVVVQETGQGRLVLGESTEQIDDTTRALLWVGLALALVISVVSVLLGRHWVRRELAPLARVATTARGIASLDLASGEVGTFERVPDDATVAGTEVGDVGLALNTMIDNVEDALHERLASESRLRQFVADASHELRTPLASIQGYTQLLQKESVDPDLALARIGSESKRMSALVEDLLLLARLDAGRELGAEPVDLVPLVIDAVSDGHAAAPDHEWRIDLAPDATETCTVLGDEGALRQVLVNLVGNARVHTPAGTTVVVGLRRRGEEVVLSVADDGPGIPEELRATVFDRFVRGDQSRTRAGAGSSGLGLSIVASIAKALGGRVDLVSSQAGTTFSVVLPAAVRRGRGGGAEGGAASPAGADVPTGEQ